ncbi:PAS domain-containing hybrid sensor histidine kinase/response regulator [Ancylomarina longa]|uniref:histidine kinase n=1 Tax=Ancylomarina longa TaxID=2487017 RepID=A0A434AGH5_9BACT|nr:PAS domain-containing hybrid sensor histidine kinase/response regulator [Ancylomarina longa]RUT73490.1 PAS domain-containing sensor histidine kinase [Ancylomarina longa]
MNSLKPDFSQRLFWKTVIILVITISVYEVTSLLLVNNFGIQESSIQSIINASILVILLAPVFYFWLLVPEIKKIYSNKIIKHESFQTSSDFTKNKFLGKINQWSKTHNLKNSLLVRSNFIGRLILILLSSIFISEVLSYILVHNINFNSHLMEAITDSLLLLVFSTPIFYLFIYLPFLKEIKRRKQVEYALLMSESKYNIAFQSSPDAILLSHIDDDKIISINKSFIKLFGYSKKELIDNYPDKIQLWENSEEKRKFTKDIKTNESIENFETSIIAKDGTKVDVLLSASIIRIEETPPILFIITKDITELKNTQEKLILAKDKAEENEKKFKDLVENTSEWIWSINTNGIFTYSNPVIEKILGYSPSFIMGKSCYSFLSPDEKIIEPMVQEYALKKKGWSNWEIKWKHKDGSFRYLLSNSIPVLNKDGELISFRGIDSDITDRKIANDQLIALKEKAEESDALKTKFLRNMSHEIRTPLNGILGFSELVSNPKIDMEKKLYYLDIIKSCGRQLLHIIDEILEISELETHQSPVFEKQVCLNELLDELFQDFNPRATQKKLLVHLKKEMGDRESTIITDDIKLSKILNSLLENALKFTKNGSIEFGYRLTTSTEPKKLQIYVKDTGSGIDSKKQKLIFERFSQAESELSSGFGGLGLGLSLAKEITELLGGEISLDSTLGEGTNFIITLPFKPCFVKEDQKKEISNKIILVAEDEEMNFLYIETALTEKLNCKIIHAKNGVDAIALCKKHSIDLILMDLKMPVLNGFDATKQIKEFLPDIPIIAQTAYSTKKDIEKALAMGCDDFISKPIAINHLQSVIEKHI